MRKQDYDVIIVRGDGRADRCKERMANLPRIKPSNPWGDNQNSVPHVNKSKEADPKATANFLIPHFILYYELVLGFYTHIWTYYEALPPLWAVSKAI